jgi:hypothetical protein
MSSHSISMRPSPPLLTPFQEPRQKDICFKVFVVASVFLAAVIVTVGVLALLASQGSIPPNLSAIGKFSVIGVPNSYMMIAAGIALFILGIASWICHLSKEKEHR